jgi:hypothetical protein
MQIDDSELPSNAALPMDEIFEPDSKITLETASQPEKQASSNCSISRLTTRAVEFP